MKDNSNIIYTLDAIKQLSRQQKADNEVYPRRLCMVSFGICDYTGGNTSGKAVISPYDDMTGIICCDEKIATAKKTIYDYCIKNSIFPVNDNILKNMNILNIKVKRSNGEIETDWLITKRSQTILLNGKLYIQVIKDIITKYISLEELCDMNNLNFETFNKLLINELEHMYLTDYESGGENMLYTKVN